MPKMPTRGQQQQALQRVWRREGSPVYHPSSKRPPGAEGMCWLHDRLWQPWRGSATSQRPKRGSSSSRRHSSERRAGDCSLVRSRSMGPQSPRWAVAYHIPSQELRLCA